MRILSELRKLSVIERCAHREPGGGLPYETDGDARRKF